ncbi:LapA family protein [Paraglaciecola sp. 25GB23A]|uniref:LapA family protein n=1 Tax=Paraglaciecola sp. 25GB23A TaxID=3156068 RepID=UPI0032AF7042
MHKLHQYLVIALSILAAIFILQNMQTVAVDILFWQINMPRALLIAFVLVIGILIGLLVRFGRNKHKNKAFGSDSE